MEIKVTDNTAALMKELQEDLRKYRQGLRLSMFRALTLIEAEILQNIRSKSGLKVRTGSLLNSVGASKRLINDGDTITGYIGTQGIPYAAIHEFGGTTKPHRIEARNAKALKFMSSGGEEIFRRFVNHPGSKIPARPYLRPALAAKKEEIFKNFGLLIEAAFVK